MGELLCIVDSESVRTHCCFNHYGICEARMGHCDFQGKR